VALGQIEITWVQNGPARFKKKYIYSNLKKDINAA
jgi:hypothetical protein